jgi:hypothetical protein
MTQEELGVIITKLREVSRQVFTTRNGTDCWVYVLDTDIAIAVVNEVYDAGVISCH